MLANKGTGVVRDPQLAIASPLTENTDRQAIAGVAAAGLAAASLYNSTRVTAEEKVAKSASASDQSITAC